MEGVLSRVCPIIFFFHPQPFFSCKRKKINNKYLWKFQLLTLLSNSRNSASVSWFCARSSRTLVNFFRPTSRTTFFPPIRCFGRCFFRIRRFLSVFRPIRSSFFPAVQTSSMFVSHSVQDRVQF